MKSFIKWAGGKTQLLPEILRRLPKEIDVYCEPFVGAGAVFANVPHDKHRCIWLGDSNKDLITTYQIIKDPVEDGEDGYGGPFATMLDVLGIYQDAHDKEFYLAARRDQPFSREQAAARFIYLNKTCFNGLYRVNKKGQFNVPMGDYKNPKICDEKLLREWHTFLTSRPFAFHHGDFDSFADEIEWRFRGFEEVFFYCDPPYDGTFTDYTPGGFTQEDQTRLYKMLKRMGKKFENLKFMVSNNDTPFIRDLYKGHKIEVVKARRNINSNGQGRGKVNEVLIRNYD